MKKETATNLKSNYFMQIQLQVDKACYKKKNNKIIDLHPHQIIS
jgi:hypothetical protein